MRRRIRLTGYVLKTLACGLTGHRLFDRCTPPWADSDDDQEIRAARLFRLDYEHIKQRLHL